MARGSTGNTSLPEGEKMSHASAKWRVATIVLVSVAMFPAVAPMAHAQTKPEHDCSLRLVKDGVPSLGSFQGLIERHPVFSFEVNGQGHVRNVRVVKGTGTPSADKKLRRAVSKWRYKSRPSCPVRETTATLTLDF
jgi:TonB family protein